MAKITVPTALDIKIDKAHLQDWLNFRSITKTCIKSASTWNQ